MKSTLKTLALLAPVLLFSCGENKKKEEVSAGRPKLVVGIVVDQMRNDYINRFWNRFGEGGFRRLVSKGYYFRNAHYNYIPTFTGPGHASIFTGTMPRHHGIIANDWFDRKSGSRKYCVYDDSARTVGFESDAGRMSPRNELSTTIGDELKLSTGKKGKVFAVALKDRSAVLPAGHVADGAFWLDETKGVFLSSSFYMDALPGWVVEFNKQKKVQAYLSKPWTTLYPIETYTTSLPDDNAYEKPLRAEKPVFPYDFSEALQNNKLSVVRSTPYGNSLTRDIAVACISAEGLGKDETPDMISISFSSPDIIGHAYGPRSIEIEDTYLRLDQDIAAILDHLDKEVGRDNYTVFLTADHGGGDVSAHLSDEKIHAGYAYEKDIQKILRGFCRDLYKDTAIIADVSNEQVFLNLPHIHKKGLDQGVIEAQLCDMLVTMRGVAAAYPSKILRYGSDPGNSQLQLLQNGYNFKRSGHVAYIYEPGFVDYGRQGCTHGSGYAYDTHVPVVFYGAGIPHGEDFSYISVTQIAPSVTELLKVSRPNACFAEPLNNRFIKLN